MLHIGPFHAAYDLNAGHCCLLCHAAAQQTDAFQLHTIAPKHWQQLGACRLQRQSQAINKIRHTIVRGRFCHPTLPWQLRDSVAPLQSWAVSSQQQASSYRFSPMPPLIQMAMRLNVHLA